MPGNVTQIAGATQVDFYLGNYTYANIIEGMGILKFRLATDINRLVFKNAAGTAYKLMHDGSGATNIPNNRVLFANADGAADSHANFTFDGTTLKIPEYLGRAGVADDYIRFQNDKITITVGGVDAMVFEDDHVRTNLYIGLKTAPGAWHGDVDNVIQFDNALTAGLDHAISNRGAIFTITTNAIYDLTHDRWEWMHTSHAQMIRYIAGGMDLMAGPIGAAGLEIIWGSAVVNRISHTSDLGTIFNFNDGDHDFTVRKNDPGGVAIKWDSGDNTFFIGGNTRIGDDAAPNTTLDVNVAQNGITKIGVVNANNHVNAQATFYSESNVATGIFGSYSTLSGLTEFQDKTIAYSTKVLALFGIDDKIQFYAGGTGSGNKYFTIDINGLIPSNNATIHAIAQEGAPTSTTEGALWLDTNASDNDTLMCYGNGAWRIVQEL